MKKLLSLLSVLTISGTAVPTTIAASSYEKEEVKLEKNKNINLEINNENEIVILKQSNLNKDSKVYFYNNNMNEVKYNYKLTPYGIGTGDKINKIFVLTTNLGNNNPTNYKNILAVGNNRTYRSWGNAVSEGVSIGKLYSGDIFYKNLINKKITSNEENIYKYIKYDLINFYDVEFLAQFNGQTSIGWTWYYENGNYYLQLLISIYASVKNSYTSAYTNVEIGAGFVLI